MGEETGAIGRVKLKFRAEVIDLTRSFYCCLPNKRRFLFPKTPDSLERGLRVIPWIHDYKPKGGSDTEGARWKYMDEAAAKADQFLLQSWLFGVCRVWEKWIRREMGDAYMENAEGVQNTIPPECSPLGDLYRFRNDLYHNGGKCSKKSAEKAEALKWFRAGDEIVLSFVHVASFLIAMGWLYRGFMPADEGRHLIALPPVGWEEFVQDGDFPWTPRMVFCRAHEKTVSVVFEDGVFGHFPMPEDVDAVAIPNGEELVLLLASGDARLHDGEAIYRQICLEPVAHLSQFPHAAEPQFRFTKDP